MSESKVAKKVVWFAALPKNLFSEKKNSLL